MALEIDPDLSTLPPLPTPDERQRTEATFGCALVIGLCTCFAGITNGIALGPLASLPPGAWWAAVVLINLEVVLALIALAGLMFGDPGVIKRGAHTCAPFPPAVAASLRGGQALPMSNVIDGDRSYCMRCLVWRSKRQGRLGMLAPHHCSTCQRCVKDFDHHCGVFGRCIAGSGLQGNYKYFCALPILGNGGAFTCVAFTAWGVGAKWGAVYALPVIAGVPFMACGTVTPCWWLAVLVGKLRGKNCCPVCMPDRDAEQPLRVNRATA